MRLSRCEVRDHINYRKKRSLALASILQSLAAAEIANALRLRDFRSPAIFEFFNTIGRKADSRRKAMSATGAYDWAVATCGITSKKESRALRFADVPRQRHDQIGLTEDGRQSEKSWQPEHHATLDSELFQNSSSNCCPVPETMPTCPSA